MEEIAKEQITVHIELLTNHGDYIFVSGMIEMAHELKAITHEERAEFFTQAQEKLVASVKAEKERRAHRGL